MTINNRTYAVLQIIGMAALGIMTVIQVIRFSNASDGMTAIEQKQVMLENRLDVIRSDDCYPESHKSHKQ